MRRIPLALVVLAACWTEETEPLAVCLVHEGVDAPSDESATPEPLNYHPDRPLEFVIRFSGNRRYTRNHRCSIARDGAEFTVAASYERKPKYFDEDDKAHEFQIRCPVDPLSPGDYTFTHAGETQTFTLPSTVPAPCLWFHPWED